jgi:hypothetical protein
MSLPVTPTYIGQSPSFMRRMTSMADGLPSFFRRLDTLGLGRSYVGLKGIRFVEKLERGSSTLSWYDRSSDVITVYPLAYSSSSRFDITFYTGLGLRHWELNVPSNLKMVWKEKLVQPNVSLMSRLEVELKKVYLYRELLSKFTTSIDRLQVIHVINALVDNNIKPQEARCLDIYSYPPIEDFCRGLRPYSLTPLLSAYRGGSGLDMNKYENAFAEFCSENGKIKAAEMSVEYELIELFKFVSNA